MEKTIFFEVPTFPVHKRTPPPPPNILAITDFKTKVGPLAIRYVLCSQKLLYAVMQTILRQVKGQCKKRTEWNASLTKAKAAKCPENTSSLAPFPARTQHTIPKCKEHRASWTRAVAGGHGDLCTLRVSFISVMASETSPVAAGRGRVTQGARHKSLFCV